MAERYVTLLKVSNPSDGLVSLLQSFFGYKALKKNGCVVVSERDRALLKGPPKFVTVGPRISLLDEPRKAVAEQLISFITPDFKPHEAEALSTLPRKIKVSGNHGINSEIHKLLSEVLFSAEDDLPELIASSLIPLLTEKFGVHYATPISINSSQIQNYFSWAKIAHLAEQHGFQKVEHLVGEQRVFRGIEMPAGIELLNLIDALTRFCPVTLTLPVHRLNCVWHFYGRNGKILAPPATESLFNQFLNRSSPRFDGREAGFIPNLHKLGDTEIWQLLRQISMGLNRLCAFICDPRTFVNKDTTIDWLRQLKSFGALHLLIADLMAICGTLDPHTRITFAYSFIDKIANMRSELGPKRSEYNVARSLLSLSEGKHLKQLYRGNIETMNPRLGGVLLEAVARTFWQVHRKIGRDIDSSRSNESVRIEHLRTLRNLTHGPFLKNAQFERLYKYGSGTAPSELGTLPFFLMLGLICNPTEFLAGPVQD